MVGLKELYVFEFKSKSIYENLKPYLSGWCFFRNDGEKYYVKAPKNKKILSFMENGLLIDVNQMTIEQ